MLSLPISFVDIETTGTSTNFSRIIEIGILKVFKNRVIKKYQTLVNPESYLDPFIQNLTGISPLELERAPTFNNIKDEVLEILKDSIFVAHNVRFDYGFIRQEFKRFGISYTSKHFCTLKLSRLLFPEWKKYNLDTLIEKFKFQVKRRHRAYDDAGVLWQFFKTANKMVGKEKFENALNIALKRPTVPINLSPDILDALPESPGVYIFYGDAEIPLYIGKSVNIRDRVMSHFSSDHISGKEMKIAREVKRIETIRTAGELGALLKESLLIKKLQPIYNRTLRINRRLIALKKTINDQGYNSIESVKLDEENIEDLENIIAVFKNEKSLKESLHHLAIDYGLCQKFLNLEKTNKFCFSYHLGYCKGACMGLENNLKYNLRFDEAFYKLKIKAWPFKSKIIIKEKSDIEEAILVDKWCVLGTLNKDDADFLDKDINYNFDYDTYKILLKFIIANNNYTPTSQTQLRN